MRLNARLIATLGLFLATLGAALLFGLAETATDDATPMEWVGMVVAVIAALGLLIDLVAPRPQAWAFVVAGFFWTYSTAYALISGSASLASLGFALIYGGFAVIGLVGWRLVTREAAAHG